MPLSTLGPTIGPSGISAPTYDAIYLSLQQSFQAIFGTDAYIDPDSQDGQLLAVVAKMVSDVNTAAIAVYNNFSPVSAQGTALSSSVKLNGLHRRVPTASTVPVQIVGQAGTNINNGIIADAQTAHRWLLPALVVIPNAGTITVVATCEDLGAVEALAGTLSRIVTPTLGWQTVTNAAEATKGNPVETDADLRRRQSESVAFSSENNLTAILAGLGQLAGVTDYIIHENPTGVTDDLGVPAHSIAVVIDGGADGSIATVIAQTKSPGCGTYGTLAVATLDPNSLPIVIDFSRPVPVNVDVVIGLHAVLGYSTDVRDAIVQSVHDYLDALNIGETLYFNRLWIPASLVGSAYAGTFQIATLTANGSNADIPVAYNAEIVPGAIVINEL